MGGVGSRDLGPEGGRAGIEPDPGLTGSDGRAGPPMLDGPEGPGPGPSKRGRFAGG
jgi:hypothetical protein